MILLKKFKSNIYILQILTLMSGTLVAQVITLAFIPILTRLYTPSEFGIYSLFLSLVGIIGMVSSLKYDQAIMLPKSDEDAQALVFLSVALTLIITFVSIIIILILHDYIIIYFEGSKLVIWFIPIGILLTGLVQIFNAYSSRNQFYKKMASVRVVNSFTLSTFQGGIKYFFNLNGLISGKLLADFLSFGQLLYYHLKKQTLNIKAVSKRRIIINAKRHDHFPKYQSFTVFLNALSQSVPILLLTSLYSAEVAGYYALTVRVLQAPIGLIGGSTREVYYQKAARLHAAGESILNLYMKTTLGLMKLFVVPFFVVLFFGQELFVFIFGSNWETSGLLAQVLILWFSFLFINSPSIMTYSILKLQKTQLYVEVISVILRVSAIYGGYLLFHSFFISIELFMVSSVAVNIFVIYYIYKKLKV